MRKGCGGTRERTSHDSEPGLGAGRKSSQDLCTIFPLRREGEKENETTNKKSKDSAKCPEQVAQYSLSCLKTGQFSAVSWTL